MKRVLAVVALGFVLVGSAGLFGCDREISKKQTVEQKPNGTTVTNTSETKETPSGAKVHTEEKTVDNPNN